MPPWPPACCPCSGQSRGHRLRPGPPALRLGLALPAPRLCPSPRSAPGAERGGSAGPARCPQRAAPPGAEQRLCEGEGGANGARRLRARPAGDLSSHKAALLGQPGRRGGVGGAAVRLIHLSGENDVITAVRRWHGLTGGGRRRRRRRVTVPGVLRNAALWHRGPCGSEGSVLCCLPTESSHCFHQSSAPAAVCSEL